MSHMTVLLIFVNSYFLKLPAYSNLLSAFRLKSLPPQICDRAERINIDKILNQISESTKC